MTRSGDFVAAAAKAPIDGPCVVWPFGVDKYGYGTLRHDGQTKTAHRLALQLRSGDPGVGFQAIHGPCHNPRCLVHLRWGTHAENMADKRRDGTVNRGSAQHLARLAEDDVRTIRVMLADGVRCSSIARWFNVHRVTIANIQSGRSWSWLH